MSSIQPLPLHLVKLESLNNLVDLSSDSSKGAISNIPLPTPAAHTHVSDSKCSEQSKSVFTPIGSSGHSNFFHPPFHLNTRECPSIIECLRRLASILDPGTN
jgi:hypothetical protein